MLGSISLALLLAIHESQGAGSLRKATIDGRVVDVVSDGAFIAEGTRIEVVQISGNRIVVREAQA